MSLRDCQDIHWGVAKLVKAPDFDSGIRRFESFLPSHSFKPFYLVVHRVTPLLSLQR